MAQPTSAQVHVDKPLTNLSVSYLQDQKHFIAGQVFPDVNVEKQSDKYFVFDRSSFFRDSMRKRGAGEESAGSGYSLSTDSYFADVFALHKDISDFDRANTDSPLNADRNAVQWLTQQAMIRKDVQWVADYFATGIWGTDNTSVAKWDNYVTSNPLGDIETAKTQILISTGQEANTLVLGHQVFAALKNHPDIRDMVKYTQMRVVTEDLLASLMGVGRVLVSRGVVDAVSEGKTSNPGLIAGKHALLCHVAPNAGIEVPSAGYTMNWTGFADAFSGQGVAIEKIRMDHLKSDRIEAHCAFDMKVVGASLGYFFGSVVS